MKLQTTILFVLSIGLIGSGFRAQASCGQPLSIVDQLLDQAARIDAERAHLEATAANIDDVREPLDRIHDQLTQALNLIETDPASAVQRLKNLEARLERDKIDHHRRLAVRHVTQLSAFFAQADLLEAERIYSTQTDGLRVSFSAKVIKELMTDDRMALFALRAIDSGSMIRLASSCVIEIRILSSQYGNYRLYGVIRSGVLTVQKIIHTHSRKHDIVRVVKELSC